MKGEITQQAGTRLYVSLATIGRAYRGGKNDVMGVPVAFEKVRSAGKVRNLTTGKQFDSIKEAAEAYGVQEGSIRRAIRRNGKCKECWWRYV